MESFDFKSVEWWFANKNQQIVKYQQIKIDRHQENENLVEFSIQLQWQTRSAVYQVTKEISQNTGSQNSPSTDWVFSETLRKWMSVAF